MDQNRKTISNIDEKIDLDHQIPHWMFPIFAGATNIICKTLILLANHPEIQLKCRNNPEYIRYTILEVLRLYPAVRTQLRTSLEDVKLSDTLVKKNTEIMIFNSLQRSHYIFNNANIFNPDNMNLSNMNSYLFYFGSFGVGTQKCPGRDLVMPFLVEALNMILINYEFKPGNKKIFNKEILIEEINFLNMNLDVCKIDVNHKKKIKLKKL